jgi:hypothetical protein
MNEMSINWQRLGVVVIGLLSLALMAMLILKYGDDNQTLQLSVMYPPVVKVQAEQRVPHPDRLLYENDTLGFSLELPKSWTGYKTLQLGESGEYEQLISVSLPVERYRENLVAPKELTNGVMLVGVRAISREYLKMGEGVLQNKAHYLGTNDQYVFYKVSLDAFENGFREMPVDLEKEIEEIYQSFQAW